MSKQRRRRFSRELKMKVIERLEAGESGTALGLELSIKRTIIYRWRDLWRQGGAAALRGKPGPRTKAEALELERARGVAARAGDLTGWALEDHLRASLAITALEMTPTAISPRMGNGPTPGTPRTG